MNNDNNRIDFYILGVKKAKDYNTDLIKYAEQIEKAYGLDARLEFEIGLQMALEEIINGRKKEDIADEVIKRDMISIVLPLTDQKNTSYEGKPGYGPRI